LEGRATLNGEKCGGLEKISVHRHTVEYANTYYRADGPVQPILP
jgi:hypothetical protein